MNSLRAVQTSFKHFGVEAIFDPDGASVPILLIPSMGDQIVGYEGLQVAAEGTLYEIQTSDWEALGESTPVFEINGTRRRVQASPKVKDSRRLVLILDSHEVTN